MKQFALLSLILLSGCLPRGNADLVWQSDDIIETDVLKITDGYYDVHLWVKNTGSEPSDDCMIEITVNGYHFLEVELDSLESNEVVRVNISLWLDDLREGQYKIKAILDSENDVNEISESNNVITDSVLVTNLKAAN